MSHPTTSLEILVTGPSGSGKTAFLKRHSTGEFVHEHQPTSGPTHGIEVVWATTKDELVSFKCLESHHAINSPNPDGFLLMVALDSPTALEDIKTYMEKLMVFEKPIYLAINKFDLLVSEVEQRSILQNRMKELIRYAKSQNVAACNISVKSNYHYESPFSYFLKTLHKSAIQSDGEKVKLLFPLSQ